jgi:phage FluMu protein Com
MIGIINEQVFELADCEDGFEGEQRCLCNRLVCIIKDDVIEIKCARCKRMTRIYTAGIEDIACT